MTFLPQLMIYTQSQLKQLAKPVATWKNRHSSYLNLIYGEAFGITKALSSPLVSYIKVIIINI